MARMLFKNTFGSQANAGGIDLQRVDLFKITIILPSALGIDWTENVEFAIEKFPFPDRQRDMIPVKYMQQTNFIIGADAQSGATDLMVRYAFQQRSAEALEKWFQLISNQRTGGVALTTQVKAKGYLRWLVPNMQKQISDLRGVARPGENTLRDGLIYELEGCMIRGLKYSDPDMTQNNYVNMTFGLQIDRVVPADLDTMQVTFV